ncbi:hypothetical protein CSW39_02270 [Thermus scotoductus]|uniref:Uncharacterized protein n=1 Tax=Thermus scotoductus TaxID=37636 RepID=A0A430S781_THESC|nr:hypothetical protein CSW48_12710 [Thermus scotoductus]RTH07309.1 hypothetical protein CSW46_10490 [Thermus scotoductus]RTH09753.1 hypothetical protein CSW44_08310 [Thermus scotoductus]RTH09840.1 hypothetical protein CSW43_10365 [Thermus scotoductus]RTH19615.1 hypothetical protein CSW39_02270 [Thermus scotoductus]
MRGDQLKEAAGFPSDDGYHAPGSPSVTLPHPGPPAKPPLPGIPQGSPSRADQGSAMKSEFSLGQFRQRTPLGVYRFLVLSFLA